MNKFNFSEVLLKVKKTDIALPLANIAKNEFLNNFKNQGFNGVKWETPQRKIPDTNAYKYPKKGADKRRSRNILIGKGTGQLRRAVANAVDTGRKNGPLSYTLVVQRDYAQIHNEGLEGRAFGKYPFKMPKRQFVGTTPELNKKLLNKVMQEFNKIW